MRASGEIEAGKKRGRSGEKRGRSGEKRGETREAQWTFLKLLRAQRRKFELRTEFSRKFAGFLGRSYFAEIWVVKILDEYAKWPLRFWWKIGIICCVWAQEHALFGPQRSDSRQKGFRASCAEQCQPLPGFGRTSMSIVVWGGLLLCCNPLFCY